MFPNKDHKSDSDQPITPMKAFIPSANMRIQAHSQFNCKTIHHYETRYRFAANQGAPNLWPLATNQSSIDLMRIFSKTKFMHRFMRAQSHLSFRIRRLHTQSERSQVKQFWLFVGQPIRSESISQMFAYKWSYESEYSLISNANWLKLQILIRSESSDFNPDS